jgi:hypothetical protein
VRKVDEHYGAGCRLSDCGMRRWRKNGLYADLWG